jgi:hypothetical protein
MEVSDWRDRPVNQKHQSLKLQIAVISFLFVIAWVPESKAGTLFSVSGPAYTSCAGPYAVGATTTCNKTYAASATVGTSVSLAAIEAIGTGTFNLLNSLTSLSLTDGSDTITLANLFTFGVNNQAGFNLLVTAGQITGWQFQGFDDSHLTFNPAEGGYDGSTVGIRTFFGFTPNQDATFVGTGCTGVGYSRGNM